ncbi:MAG: hypothetical protein ACP5N2_02180 [Candidatus Nanoarchaeia archaeon]
MKTSRNYSGPFITGPNDYDENTGFGLKDFVILTTVIGSMAGVMYGINCIDKYLINPKRNEKDSNLKQLTADFQKYDKNKDGVLNYKEFLDYYKQK